MKTIICFLASGAFFMSCPKISLYSRKIIDDPNREAGHIGLGIEAG